MYDIILGRGSWYQKESRGSAESWKVVKVSAAPKRLRNTALKNSVHILANARAHL
jgi:hypothetical protein